MIFQPFESGYLFAWSTNRLLTRSSASINITKPGANSPARLTPRASFFHLSVIIKSYTRAGGGKSAVINSTRPSYI